MRGKVHFTSPHIVYSRITPAYAGKRDTTHQFHFRYRDHPRLCGEKSAGTFASAHANGSPPPMRGKVFTRTRFFPDIRITPAYAGKSQMILPAHLPVRDHPRLCGEKDRSYMQVSSGAGSPPPMRGKVLDRQIFPIICRITPAYAGKRFFDAGSVFSKRDHPRLCGEKPMPFCYVLVCQGSPPPMRGKVFDKFGIRRFEGITPAYAGKRRQQSLWKQ